MSVCVSKKATERVYYIMSNSPLKTLLTQTQTDILFGEALANPDEQQFPLGDDEIVDAVQRFLKDRDSCAKLVEQLENKVEELEEELECRKSHTDTEIGELKASNQQYIGMFNAVVESEGEKVDKIDKLENTVKAVWIELYAQDKYGCNVDWKSIADLIEYDEEQAKKLYEEEYPFDPELEESDEE